ncbi:hypothetical protein F925_01764 [Acinetobacter lwoffii NCTC 5866 = CIP 64.10 = NIPH 512]|nr:hypothetical protein F925_01764 [Acinetobacter lwoffii NCTC 5866 = CIP 64.10 = NIPH 512]
MEKYKVSFYLDNENLDIENEGIFIANSKKEAVRKAILELNPTERGFYTVMLWGRPD